MVIFYKYKNTLDNFIDSSDVDYLKSLNWLKQINKEICNSCKFKNALLYFLKNII